MCSFLATDKTFLALEHRTSRAATAPWVSNDQYSVKYLHAEYGYN